MTDTADSYTGRIFTLKVGENAKEELTCQKALLEEQSPFFRAALDKWCERQNAEIDLLGDELEAITAYVSWLYDSAIDSKESFTGSKDATYPYLAILYVFGEKVQHD